MQIEHKTEKGTLCFVKAPDNSADYSLNEDGIIFGIPNTDWEDCIHMDVKGFKLFGLSKNITELKCKKLVKPMLNGLYFDYIKDRYAYSVSSYIDSFKSLMQHLQITDEKWIVLFKPND